MDGQTALTILRASKKTKDIPLIMIKPTIYKKHVGAMSVIDMYWTLSELPNGNRDNGKNTNTYR